jgi:hypothetical protein
VGRSTARAAVGVAEKWQMRNSPGTQIRNHSWNRGLPMRPQFLVTVPVPVLNLNQSHYVTLPYLSQPSQIPLGTRDYHACSHSIIICVIRRGGFCKTAMQRFDPARRLHTALHAWSVWLIWSIWFV